MRYPLSWTVGHTLDPSVPPDRFVTASVPGAVQLDWARAEGWPHYWQDPQLDRYEWMERLYWIYECRLSLPEVAEGQRLFLVGKGVDYRFLVRLEGRTLYGQEGMYAGFEIDLSELAADGQILQIVVFPAPEMEEEIGPDKGFCRSLKPSISYGGSFQPRLVPMGIWREIYLETRSLCHIRDLNFDYVLEEDFGLARLDLAVELSVPCHGSLEWTLMSEGGEIVDAQSVSLLGSNGVDCQSEVHDPALWWPQGYGEPNLYLAKVALHAEDGSLLDQRSFSVGFRKVALVRNEARGSGATEANCERIDSPMTLVVNGSRVFVKGANWVSPDLFPGALGEDAYRPLLEKAKFANLNLLRCWGGSAVNKESFYDICDRLGLMVWQDFPLAGRSYGDDPEFLDTLNRESSEIIARLKLHPSVVVWCGGSELFARGAGLTEQSKALRLLDRNCLEATPDTPFLRTVPVTGSALGPRLFLDREGRECLARIQSAHCAAYLAFGTPGPAGLERLRMVMGVEELFPPKAEGAWAYRRGFGALPEAEEAWLCLSTIEGYFGHSESLEELLIWGHLLQGEGIKALFEEARRQKPVCSMALLWTLNESWPMAASPAVISWPCEPKPSYKCLKQSCRPILASARVRKFAWREGEVFEAELWVLNDAQRTVKGDRIEAHLRLDDEETFVLGWYFDPLEPDENLVGPTLRYRLPRLQEQTFRLILRVEGRPDWNSEYCFCYQE